MQTTWMRHFVPSRRVALVPLAVLTLSAGLVTTSAQSAAAASLGDHSAAYSVVEQCLRTRMDIDGDCIRNNRDRDIDGDGIRNGRDRDVDGDGILNRRDRDIDGDGIRNSRDRDMDGDGIRNNRDRDRDGDGLLNRRDRTPNGPARGR